MKIIFKGKGVVKMKVIIYCIMVCIFMDGLVCRIEDSILFVFNSLLELKNVFFFVFVLLIFFYYFIDVFWINVLIYICWLRGNDVKEILIYFLSIILDLDILMFGYVFLNGMFVVFDWEKCCVFIIGKLGKIEIMKFIGFKFGLIFLDFNNIFYVCDF